MFVLSNERRDVLARLVRFDHQLVRRHPHGHATGARPHWLGRRYLMVHLIADHLIQLFKPVFLLKFSDHEIKIITYSLGRRHTAINVPDPLCLQVVVASVLLADSPSPLRGVNGPGPLLHLNNIIILSLGRVGIEADLVRAVDLLA